MATDDSLPEQLPPGVRVCRTASFEPFRWKKSRKKSEPEKVSHSRETAPVNPGRLSTVARIKKMIKLNLSVPDTCLFWSWWGLFPGIRLVKKENIDIILSSSPPHTAHILASRIAHFTGRPHIVDFRDLWTQNTGYAERNLPSYLQRRDRRFEERVLKRAAAVAVNTATFKRQLLEKNPFLSENRVEVVTNGVDPDDFIDLIESKQPDGRFTMLYTGSLYGEHRNPEFFLAAVRLWLDKCPEIAGEIRLRLIGNWTEEYSGLINRYNLGDIVEKREWLPQKEVLREILAADMLLLFQGFDPALSAAIPRKLYEYMIANKPILAFAPPGEIPDLIERYQCGVCFSEKTPEPIIAFMRKSLGEWKAGRQKGEKPAASLRSMPELETSTQVKRLAALCNRII
jgi:glycosyltransferase involved in cell wall biosynthesis